MWRVQPRADREVAQQKRRSPSQIAASRAILAPTRNVDIPYESSNSRDTSTTSADFREYLKSDSDLHFAKFAAAALKHSVPLNKTSH